MRAVQKRKTGSTEHSWPSLGPANRGWLPLRPRERDRRRVHLQRRLPVARPNEFVVQTFEFEGFPDVVSIETLRFQDLGNGRTRLAIHSTYPSQEARDRMIASGMAKGVTQGYERLDAILADL